MASMDIVLSVVSGPRQGLRFRASGRNRVTMGRSKRTDFPILDSAMSREHAAVVLGPDGWLIEDLGSSNGVWIGDKRIKKVRLNEGMIFRLGEPTAVEFQLVPSNEREPGEVILEANGTRTVVASEKLASSGEPATIENLVGRELGEFRVVERMEEIEYAAFFRAHQPTLSRTVMLEVFDGTQLDQPGFREALLAEVRRASRYVHPHILQILDFMEDKGLAFVVMEHFKGAPLGAVLEKQRFVKIGGAIQLANQILEALQYALEQGSALSWMGTGSVLVSARHDAKVKLFQEPKLGEERTRTVTEIAYTAPEVLKGDAHEGAVASAVYSVGAILYHMLSGIPPFEGASVAEVTRRVLHESPPSLRRINLKVSPALARVVEGAIERDPARRPETVAEFLEQLRAAVGRGR